MTEGSASTAISRRQFLRADFRAERTSLRPPWARPESAFLASCTACGACIGVCPERVLRPGWRSLPEVDFRRGGCTFCGLCVEHCPTHALVRAGSARPWQVRALVGAECLAASGVTCRSCADFCEHDAITFRPALGAPAQPRIDQALCSGCGVCVASCPSHAIRIQPASGASALDGTA